MYSLLTLSIASFGTALLLTPILRDVAIRWGLLDQPDQGRKLHDRAVPRVGGVPIVAAYVAAFAMFLLSSFEGSNIVRNHFSLVGKIFPAAILIFITGLLDDLIGLRPWQKLLGQIAAAVTVYAAGIHFTGVSGYEFGIWWTLPATILWLVGCTNAFNLIDGVDGLAAGVGFFATLTTLIAALLQHNIPLAMATAPLAGALLGFLRYNFNPATIFLGDCGSLLIGFLLGCYALVWNEKSATILGMTAPLMVLAIPLVDTGLAVIRRYLRNQPIFGADRGHIHHRLLARGFTPRRVALLMYGICGISAGLSLLQSAFQERLGGPIIVIFCVGAWMGIQRLGYAEFEMARRLVLGGTFRRLLNAELQLVSFRNDLIAAETPDQCWDAMHRAYSDFGFNEIELRLGGRTYFHATHSYDMPNTWAIRIRLSDTEYVKLARGFDTKASPLGAPFADVVGTVLNSKISDVPEEFPAELLQT